MSRTKSKSSKTITPAEVAALAGVSTSTIHNWIRDGRLPAPIRFSPRCTRWNREAIERHLAQLEAEAEAAASNAKAG